VEGPQAEGAGVSCGGFIRVAVRAEELFEEAFTDWQGMLRHIERDAEDGRRERHSVEVDPDVEFDVRILRLEANTLDRRYWLAVTKVYPSYGPWED
jgi:hypothetical protein